MNTPFVGRLAPSPTGFLHLGNAWSFLWAWLWARSQKGRVVLRMEDIDPDRSRPEYAKAIEEDLRWLGLDWDGPCMMQSIRNNAYNLALSHLKQGGHIYPCYCTRKELRSLAGAPHVEDMGAPYPGTCRELSHEERVQKELQIKEQKRGSALRLRCPHGPDAEVRFHDAIYGTQHYNLHQCGGDFALCRSDGVLAYQLAVVVDDAFQGVTHILRGSDILISTPRQILLCNLLGYAVPQYAHVPLLLDAKGERLAKRHESLTLRALRTQGAKPELIIGLMAYLAGLRNHINPIPASALINEFDLTACSNFKEIKQDGIIVKDEYIGRLFE